jgi:hypothetical protein
VDAIVLTPDHGGETLQIELRGESGGHVGRHLKNEEVARNKRPLAASSKVAGARNQRYLQLWSVAER